MNTTKFTKKIYSFYRKNKRILPWRWVNDPYKIYISEIMLQQTQVSRVLLKYDKFIKQFPNFSVLSKASLRHILSLWQGLGYNRRGKYVKESAKIIMSDKRYIFLLKKNCLLPDTNTMLSFLKMLPGIGYSTSCAIVTYAFNLPTIFVETNVRSVFLYHFFQKRNKITDDEIKEMIKKTLDYENPRKWYYAVTDYGAFLKRKGFRNIMSMHYKRQSPFHGSRRQLRGKILKLLLRHTRMSCKEIKKAIPDSRTDEVIEDLIKEQFITRKQLYIYIIR